MFPGNMVLREPRITRLGLRNRCYSRTKDKVNRSIRISFYFVPGCLSTAICKARHSVVCAANANICSDACVIPKEDATNNIYYMEWEWVTTTTV
jgi:hypothetical protein